MSIDKQKNNPENFDSKKLLNELINDIAFKFGIDKEKTKKLLKADISKGLKNLKQEIEDINDEKLNSLTEKKLQELFFTLKGAKEVIENSSKIEIKNLRESVENNLNIIDFKNDIEKYLPESILKKAKNPNNINDHIIGIALGTANSIYKTVDILYRIGMGILKTPYHIYLIISNKGKTNSFKNI